jgi:hypothetical protein
MFVTAVEEVAILPAARLLTLPVTLTLHVAVRPPSAVLAVIVAAPVFTPVTVPSEATEAIVASDEDQVTLLFVAVVGATVDVSLSVAPISIESVVLLRLTDVGWTVKIEIGVYSIRL